MYQHKLDEAVLPEALNLDKYIHLTEELGSYCALLVCSSVSLSALVFSVLYLTECANLRLSLRALLSTMRAKGALV
jgi:hypothetical protein